MGAYELVLKGLEYAKKGNVIKENTENAVKLFEQAIDADPSYARAHAWRACSLSNLADWEKDPDPSLFKSAMESAHLAIDLDPNDPEAHRIMGAIKIFMEKDYELGKFHFEKARELCPSDVYLISRYALMLIYIGDCEKALSELKRAMRLDPFSHDVLFAQEGMCYYWLEDYKKAVESFRKVKILRQNLFYLAACYIKMGDLDTGLEKLKEAETVTGQDSDAFVDSLAYEQKDMMSDLRNTLNSVKG